MSETPVGPPRLSEDDRAANAGGAAPPRVLARAPRIFHLWPKAGSISTAGASMGGVSSPQVPSAADPNLIRFFRRLSGLAGIAVTVIGVVVLIGHFKGFPSLTSINVQWPTMKGNTAAAMIVSGIALLFSTSSRRIVHRLVQLCAVFLVLLGAATLGEYASGRDFGIDQLLIAEPPGAVATPYPGRMPVLASVNFVLCGLALFLLGRQTKNWAWLSSALALLAAIVAAIVILCYAFGAVELYTAAHFFMAASAPTAAAFFLLGNGISFARIDESVLQWLASPLSGGVMLRRMLPLAILLPAAIAELRLTGEFAGLFTSDEFGVAAVAVMNIVTLSAALLWSAALLNRLDRERLDGESQIIQLNAELRQHMRELEVANKELEGFSYATSHVLRAPLRAMAGFSQLLLEDYCDKLDEEGKRLLGVVRSSALEMGELVDGILEFLRLGQAELSRGPIDMATAVGATIKELEAKTRERKLKIEISSLPIAYGDSAMIQRVWINLLDNAIKFTARKAEAIIQVGAVSGENETIYYVRDNGAGFDMQYAHKLFGVFERLHGEEFAGSGIGLAIVKRIVARHGGSVWAEGKPNEGAAFYFSLPRRERGRG
jgi:signal transduction histidine kinase